MECKIFLNHSCNHSFEIYQVVLITATVIILKQKLISILFIYLFLMKIHGKVSSYFVQKGAKFIFIQLNSQETGTVGYGVSLLLPQR